MSDLTTLDIISISTHENIDNIIDVNPYSTPITIKRLTDIKDEEIFGYEEYTVKKEFKSVGLIMFNPERRWLKMIGIDTEEHLPIVGLFKHSDKLKKTDIIIQKIKEVIDGNIVETEREFEIVDVLSYGGVNNVRKAYKLSWYRGNPQLIENE